MLGGRQAIDLRVFEADGVLGAGAVEQRVHVEVREECRGRGPVEEGEVAAGEDDGGAGAAGAGFTDVDAGVDRWFRK